MKRKIKLTKYAFNEESDFLTLDSNFELSENHPNGIDIGYTKTGTPSAEPAIGESYRMISDNGRFFMSSPVVKIFSNGFKTANSLYKLEVIETLDKENIQDNNIIL